jgi:hypothetical protein
VRSDAPAVGWSMSYLAALRFAPLRPLSDLPAVWMTLAGAQRDRGPPGGADCRLRSARARAIAETATGGMFTLSGVTAVILAFMGKHRLPTLVGNSARADRFPQAGVAVSGGSDPCALAAVVTHRSPDSARLRFDGAE